MAMTGKEAIEHVEDALGTSSDQVPLWGVRMVNQAGRLMCQMHRWRWLVGGRATLATVADQDYIELPSDFRRLLGYWTVRGLQSGIRLTTASHLLGMRASEIIVTSAYHWGTIVHGVPSTGGPPRHQIEVWPTPVSGNAAFMNVYYARQWGDITGDSRELLSIPQWIEPLFIEILRATAKAWREDDPIGGRRPDDLSTWYDRIRRSRLFLDAARDDSLEQPDYGELRNGAAEMASGPGVAINFTGTDPPFKVTP